MTQGRLKLLISHKTSPFMTLDPVRFRHILDDSGGQGPRVGHNWE